MKILPASTLEIIIGQCICCESLMFDPALQKMLSFEYGRVLYVTMALFTNDATACFNQMVPNISTLVAQKYGMDLKVMISRNLVMADMEHSVHIKHGNSCDTYREESGDVKIAGETQGTSSAGCLWSIKSHMFLRTHQTLHEGINLPHVNGTRNIRRNNDVFLDDADAKAAQQGATFSLSERKLVAHLVKGAQLWAKLIGSMGCAITQHRSVWQMLSWWDNTYSLTLKEYSSLNITISDCQGVKTTIMKRGSSVPKKGLGCLQAPTAQQTSKFNHRLQK